MNNCRFCEKPEDGKIEMIVDSESVQTCCVWDLYFQIEENEDWDSIDFKNLKQQYCIIVLTTYTLDLQLELQKLT